MEKNYKSVASGYGITLGIILAMITVIAYVFSPELFTKWWLGILLFVLVILFAIFSVVKCRKIIDGFMTFKQAFTAYFFTVAIALFINTVVMILIFNVIDTDAADQLQEITLEMTREMMSSFGATEAQINEAMLEAEKENQYSIGAQLQRFVFGLAFYSIIGLIIALIFRQKDPQKA